MKPLLPLSLAAALLVAACGTSDEPTAPAGEGAEHAAQASAVPAAVREVRCGCKLEHVGACGNYVAVDGDWLEIANPQELGLGKMEWCGATGQVDARVAGERRGEQILVSELEVQ